MRAVFLIILLFGAAAARAQTANSPTLPVREPANWKEFVSSEGRFRIDLPGIPTIRQVPVDTDGGKVVMHLTVLMTEQGEFGVSYADLPVRSNDPVFVRGLLDGSRDQLLAGGAKALNEKEVTVDGQLGRELILENVGLLGRHWMFLVDGRLYGVVFATTPQIAFKDGKFSANQSTYTSLYEQLCNKFFGSLRFKDSGAKPPTTGSAANSDVLSPISAKTELYRSDVVATRQIEDALQNAGLQQKRVMLIFGGNWCYDCHVLDQALHEGEAGKIVKESFLLVHVDIGEGDKNLDVVKKYEATLSLGVPVVVILDEKGKVVYSSTRGEFEAARRMMKKDLVAFLNKWKQKVQ